MPTDRRSFLRLAAAAGGAATLGSLAPGVLSAEASGLGLPDVPRAPRSLDLLILGGTGFTGPHQIRYAVARGHRVTVFNRGQSEADLPGGVEELRGDRNLGDVGALRGRAWDVVIDNPTTLPFWVRDAAEVLHDATDQYLFISTLSVYDLTDVREVDESSPLQEYDNGDPLGVSPESYAGGMYGPMKVASEREARRWYGDRTTIIRPGLIVGPRDPTDRFTYWPVRLRRGGDIVAPGSGNDPVQIIDARDLAEWTIRMAETKTTGTFNATGPRSLLTMAGQLHGIRAALSGDLDLRIHWIPADFLADQDVRRWSEMTTWFGPQAVISETRIDRALAAGLTFRPLAVTVAETLEWFDAESAERRGELRAGLDPRKEREVLDAWAASRERGE